MEEARLLVEGLGELTDYCELRLEQCKKGKERKKRQNQHQPKYSRREAGKSTCFRPRPL